MNNTLDLNAMGVSALTQNELANTDGGLIPLFLVGCACIGTLAGGVGLGIVARELYKRRDELGENYCPVKK